MKYFDLSSLESVPGHGLKNGVFRLPDTPYLHRHSEVELNYLEQGSITYMFGAQRVSMQQGQFALFWAVIPHQIIQTEEQTMLHWVTLPFAHFLQCQLPDVLTQPIICGQFVAGPVDTPTRSTFAMFQRWQEDLRATEQSTEHQMIVLLEIEVYLRRLALSIREGNIVQISAESSNPFAHKHELTKVEQMACFIAEHYTEPLHIEGIADVVHLHPSYAMEIFRKHFGLSMLDYITQYRLSHAQRLLITSDANTSEIAFAAGFGSVSRFYAIFKDFCGQSPGGYRTAYHQAWKEGAQRFPMP